MSEDSFKKSGTVTEIMHQQERIRDVVDPPALRSIREAQERIRDIMDPPAFRAMREAQDRFRDIVDPPALREMREAQGRIRDIVDPPAFRTMRETQERIRDIVDPPFLRSIQEAQERIRDIVDPPSIRALREAQERFQDIVDPPALRTMREAQARIRDIVDPPSLRAVRAAMGAIRESSKTMTATSLTTFARSAQLLGCGTTVIEAALRHGHMQDKADTAALTAIGISKLAPQLMEANFVQSEELIDAGVRILKPAFANASAELVAEVPSEVFRALDLDIYLPSSKHDFVEKERVDLATTTSGELESLLADLDPQLLALLHGARGAANSQNPDRARHLCISLRELLGHTLRQLAPDTEVSAWTQDSSHFHNGKPTRKARIQYLYKGVEEPSLRSFIAADIRTTLELFDVLSNGAHIVNLGASETGLSILLNRAEGFLLLLLRLSGPQT